MDLVTLRRRNTAWCIQQNPAAITIQRIEKVAAGGALTEVKSFAGPFTVRIFQQGGSRSQDLADIPGSKQVTTGWGMLADHLADLRSGSGVSDEFDVDNLGHFRVAEVRPQLCQGQVVGYQADLEKVS